jgi:hypothetical protein
MLQEHDLMCEVSVLRLWVSREFERDVAVRPCCVRIIARLLATGETATLDGFISKKFKRFRAKLVLNKDKVEFKFD